MNTAVSEIGSPASEMDGRRLVAAGRLAERAAASGALLAIAVLPVIELLLRALLNTGVPGSTGYVQNLTLWVGFAGAMVAARQRQHLTFVPTLEFLPASARRMAAVFSAFVTAAVLFALAAASVQFVVSELQTPNRIGGWLPPWAIQTILPVCFTVIGLRCILQAGGAKARAIAALSFPAALVIGFAAPPYADRFVAPGFCVLAAAALLGAPIYAVLSGVPLLLFLARDVPIASIPVETYRLVVSPIIPTIPLFALTGFILTAGGTSRRLLRLFRALFGWLPGGLPIVATLVCAFFTTFTGASGVTILALGGLLLPVLSQSNYRERFCCGLLTATGSIGILFPPSLPVILYAVVAHVPIPDLFKAGLAPGILMVGAVCLLAVREGSQARVPRRRFDVREACAALWECKWEILLPVITVAALFGGFCTLLEAAAATAVYALMIETAVYRDLEVIRDVPPILVKCAAAMGGIFIILAGAMGLTNYLVDAQIPDRATIWVQAHIHSRLLFLLALNLFLFIVGCLMDIYSAIIVQAPLLLPIGRTFGIDPIHMGIIFLANLELGYLTPPVGLNLFLASYRFEKPVLRVFRDTLPFLLLLVLVVLLISYLPALTLRPGQ